VGVVWGEEEGGGGGWGGGNNGGTRLGWRRVSRPSLAVPLADVVGADEELCADWSPLVEDSRRAPIAVLRNNVPRSDLRTTLRRRDAGFTCGGRPDDPAFFIAIARPLLQRHSALRPKQFHRRPARNSPTVGVGIGRDLFGSSRYRDQLVPPAFRSDVMGAQ